MLLDDLTLLFAGITAVATAVLAIGIPLTLNKTRDMTDKSLSESRYAEYCRRYQEIVSHLAYDIFLKENTKSDLKDLTNEEKSWLVAYIDLCHEEHYDFRHHAIDAETWEGKKDAQGKIVEEGWAAFIVEDFRRSIPLQQLIKRAQEDYKMLYSFLEKEEAFQKP